MRANNEGRIDPARGSPHSIKEGLGDPLVRLDNIGK